MYQGHVKWKHENHSLVVILYTYKEAVYVDALVTRYVLSATKC